MSKSCSLLAVLVVFMIGLIAAGPAAAQGSGTGTEAAVQTLQQGGNTVFVVPTPQDTASTAAPAPPSLPERIARFRLALEPVFVHAPEVPGDVAAALLAAGDGSLGWLMRGLLLLAVSLAVGFAALWYAGRLAESLVVTLGMAPGDTRAGKIGHALERLIRGGLAAGALFAAGTVTALLVVPHASPVRETALVGVLAVAAVIAVRTVFAAILAPEEGAARIVPFDDRAARSFYTQLAAGLYAIAVVAFLGMWLRRLPLDPMADKFLVTVSSTVTFLVFTTLLLGHRREITAAIAGTGPRPRPLRKVASVLWPLAVLAYFGGAWLSAHVAIAYDLPLSAMPVLGPTFGIVAALATAGFLLILHDQRLRTGIVNAAWSELYERAAIGLAVLVGVGVTLFFGGAFEGGWGDAAGRGLGIAVVTLLAWTAWQAVRIWVTIRLEDEQGSAGHEDTEGEGFGQGGTRLATLLPIFRNVMFFLIASIVVMVVLSSLGVNVGPLFAGAGVVGLAIGFGAQTLIRDIFSGAFFLLDDAFRKGEYVDVGGTMGTVEKISVRSFQLRHHNGPLHTIPFGEIKQLTNFSRDWVVMKLPVRLTYDTDVEKVRKLVKKLGQKLAEDPEIGPLFLDPLKSQGVVQMDDSAMIMRVKFKTKPGDQFTVRRHVYRALRDLFEENDIHFAHREVLVRVAGTEDEEMRQKAALGAVRALEDEGKKAKTADAIG